MSGVTTSGAGTLESLDPEDQSLRKMTRRVMRVLTPSPPLVTPGGTAVSDPEKAEALVGSLECQFQPVNDPSDPAVIEKVAEALQAYSYALQASLSKPTPWRSRTPFGSQGRQNARP
jgi:hypothetical protein